MEIKPKNIKIPVYGNCALCSENKILSGEHMLGAWIGRVTKEIAPLIENSLNIPHLNINRTRYGKPPGGHANTKLIVLCYECNNVFSSKIQESVVSTLTPLLNGEWGSMSNNHRINLTNWFICFAMVRQCLDPQLITFTRNERRNFRRTKEIPDGTELWAIPMANDENTSRTWHRAFAWKPRVVKNRNLDSYLILCNVGKVMFIGFGTSNKDLADENTHAHLALVKVLSKSGARRIWPIRSKFPAHKPRKEVTPQTYKFVVPFLTNVLEYSEIFLNNELSDDFEINEFAMQIYGPPFGSAVI